MTLPSNFRVNTTIPFPALVQGSGPISVNKSMGLWTVSLNFGLLGQQLPQGPQLNTDFLAVWDSIVGTYFTVPLSFFSTAGTAIKQRLISSPTDLPLIATDQQLNLNLSAPTTITLPGFASRNGLPLTFKDAGMQAGTNNITFAAAAGETIDGFATVAMSVDGESITFLPANDGMTTGWLITN